MQKNNLLINIKFQNYPHDVKDSLLYETNSYIHYYGNHFKGDRKGYLFRFTKFIFYYFKYLYFYFLKFTKSSSFKLKRKNVLCNAYFDLSAHFQKSLNVVNVPWEHRIKNNLILDKELDSIIYKIKNVFEKKSLNKIFDPSFIFLIDEYKVAFKKYLVKHEFKALVFSIDITFFESISISCARELGIKTFLFLHGLPARYNSIDDNRTDFLFVWGNAIKENYVGKGVSPKKIFVTGHPIFSQIQKKTLKSSLDNVLVVTKAMCGTPHSDEVRLMDRSHSLYYLELLRELLQNLGVAEVRLRCHPSEDPMFYKRHLSGDFFKIDFLSLNLSLQKSTLVVGPGSSMILDSLNAGVNYILFEPIYKGKSLTGFDIVPPFDGKHFIASTFDLESFRINLNPSNNIEWNLVHEYAGSDFSLNDFYNLI